MWNHKAVAAMFIGLVFSTAASAFTSSMPIIGECDHKTKAEIIVSTQMTNAKSGTEFDVFFTISKVIGKGKEVQPLGTPKNPKGEMFRIGTLKVDAAEFEKDIPFTITTEQLSLFTIPEENDKEWTRWCFLRVDTLLIDTKTKAVLKFDEPRGVVLFMERERGEGITKLMPLWKWIETNANDPKLVTKELATIDGYLPLTNKLNLGYTDPLADDKLSDEVKKQLIETIPAQVVHSKYGRALWMRLVTLAEGDNATLRDSAETKLKEGREYWGTMGK
jgi:hypothetical protein